MIIKDMIAAFESISFLAISRTRNYHAHNLIKESLIKGGVFINVYSEVRAYLHIS